jgi:hypothetical protein
MLTLEQLNKIGIGKLPGHLGIVITHVDGSEITAEIAVLRVRASIPRPGYSTAGSASR